MSASCPNAVTPPDFTTLSPERLHRYQAVQSAIRHAWNGYTSTCLTSKAYNSLLGVLPPDDLDPINNACITWLHSAATLYDSLDTLYLAGLDEEYKQAKSTIENLPLPLHPTKTFEYSIRVLGGLLGIYSITGEEDYLRHAKRIADSMLEGPFAASPTVLPRMFDVLAPAKSSFLDTSIASWGGWIAHWVWGRLYRIGRDYMGEHHENSLAGVGSFALEFSFLSQVTGDVKYQNAADAIYHHVDRACTKKEESTTSYNNAEGRNQKLSPVMWNVMTGEVEYPMTSLGSGSDSYYEYLIKTSILLKSKNNNDIQKLHGEEDQINHISRANLFLESYHNVINDALLKPEARHVYKVSEEGGDLDHYYTVDKGNEYEHLLCYVPGMLALGFRYYPSESETQMPVMSLARNLTLGCWETYKTTVTGLGPETMRILSNKKLSDASFEKRISDAGYYLRPEFVESLFVLYRTTGDKQYQEIAWEVFQSLEHHCKLPIGYSSLTNVNEENGQYKNEMPSFFIAETLKYLLLIFAPDEYVSLDDFVFTTEAHPLWRTGERLLPDTDVSKSTCLSSNSIFSKNMAHQPIAPILVVSVNFLLCLLLYRVCKISGVANASRSFITRKEKRK